MTKSSPKTPTPKLTLTFLHSLSHVILSVKEQKLIVHHSWRTWTLTLKRKTSPKTKSKSKFFDDLCLRFRLWGIDFVGVGSALDQFWNIVERHKRYGFLPLGPFPKRPLRLRLFYSETRIVPHYMFPVTSSYHWSKIGMFAGRLGMKCEFRDNFFMIMCSELY